MAQLYAKKTSDGLPRALECTDEGLLKVDTDLTATIDPTGLASETTLASIKTSTDALALATPDTSAGDLAAINSASASINGKLPALVNGKIPVDASVSIDSVDISDVDIKEFPAGNLGQQLKAASLSVAPATDITDATYIGDVRFGEELPAGTQLVGKVGIDQTTPGTTNLVNVNGGTSQTADIKVTLDSESVAVTGPLTDAQLTTQALAKEATLGSIKTATEALAVAIPDTAAGDLADINTASASIDGKLPAIGQQLKVASLSIVPASDADDVKVSLDSEVVAINGGVGQTDDIKVTLDSESVAVTGPLTDAQLTTQALAKEATLDSVKTAVEAIAVATPDTAAGDLASMSADLGTIRADIATVKADIATVASNSEITPATVTGTCTAAYATALSLACAGVRNKTIVVVNTDAALTMKYRVRGFAKSGSSYYNEIQAEATLAASTSQPHVIENSYDVVTVEVIDGTGHATYAIDYCGGQ